jgi:tetratricopeptide (TPR) repeat protein
MLRYATVQGFKPGWQSIIDSSGAQYILWPRNEQGRPLAELVTSGRWRVLFGDFVSVLLVRSDQQPPGPLKPSPDSAYRRVTEGVINLEQRRFDEAERNFRDAFAMTPFIKLACDSLARAQAEQGKKQEALHSLQECQRIFPDDARALTIKALGN